MKKNKHVPAFLRVNYSLRPKKQIERKIIVDVFNFRKDWYNFEDYCYIGMGSVWYIDFLLFHRHLHIPEMISIEREQGYKRRINFNCPLACILPLIGEADQIVSNELPWEEPNILWLDLEQIYDDRIMNLIDRIVEKVRSRDIIILTVKDGWYELNSKVRNSGKTKKEELKSIHGEYFDDKISNSEISEETFSKITTQAIFSLLDYKMLQSGSDLRYQALFTYDYADSTRMLTIGGIFLNNEDRESFELSQSQHGKHEFEVERTVFKINAPILTIREKHRLDSFMPLISEKIEIDKILRKLGFEIDRDEFICYSKVYKYYPLFNEIIV